jgi:AraC-like DNA-binding protein
MGYRNFNQFLNFYRLGEASKRLRETEAPVSAIAFEVGYASLSSFNSVFKNQFALTPTEYRQSAQQDE